MFQFKIINCTLLSNRKTSQVTSNFKLNSCYYSFWILSENFNKLMLEKHSDTTWRNTAAIQAWGFGSSCFLRAHLLFVWSHVSIEKEKIFYGMDTPHSPHLSYFMSTLNHWVRTRAQNTTVYSQCRQHQWTQQSRPKSVKFITGEFSCIEKDLFLIRLS